MTDAEIERRLGLIEEALARIEQQSRDSDEFIATLLGVVANRVKVTVEDAEGTSEEERRRYGPVAAMVIRGAAADRRG